MFFCPRKYSRGWSLREAKLARNNLVERRKQPRKSVPKPGENCKDQASDSVDYSLPRRRMRVHFSLLSKSIWLISHCFNVSYTLLCKITVVWLSSHLIMIKINRRECKTSFITLAFNLFFQVWIYFNANTVLYYYTYRYCIWIEQ